MVKPVKMKKAMKQTVKITAIASLIIAGALASGCYTAKEQLETDDPVTAQGRTVTLTASVGLEVSTKALDPVTGVKTFKAGERIAVIYIDESNATQLAYSEPFIEEDIDEDGKKADFTITLTDPKAGSKVRYIYPAEKAYTDVSSFEPDDDSTLELAYLFYQNGSAEAINGLDCATFDGNLTSKAKLPAYAPMKNRLTIVVLNIKNPEGDDITEDITELTFDIEEHQYNYSPETPSATIYMAMRPVSSNVRMFITATDGSNEYFKVVSGKTLSEGRIYPIGLGLTLAGSIFYGGEDNAMMEGGDGVDILFGDSGIENLADQVAFDTGVPVSSLTDSDILQYVVRNPDKVADWPGADVSQTDPQTGEIIDKADVLTGEKGSDIIFAQGGDDIVLGDSSLDGVALWLEIEGDLTVSDVEQYLSSMPLERIKIGLSDFENTSDGDDVLLGGEGNDSLFGLGGGDTLYGGPGDDLLYGGKGCDNLDGGDGSDYLDGGDDADTLYGGEGFDIIRYDSADTIDGGDGFDLLLGNSDDGSLADLLNVSNVELFVKITDGDIDSINITDLDKVVSFLNLYVYDDEIALSNQSGIEPGSGWDLDSVTTDENGITTITFTNGGVTVILETTLQATVNTEENEIILS